MVEAQAFGKPVIAFKAGGALEIVKDGKTGILFQEQSKEGLMKAIKKFEKSTFSQSEIKKQAATFSAAAFKKSFLGEVGKLFANS